MIYDRKQITRGLIAGQGQQLHLQRGDTFALRPDFRFLDLRRGGDSLRQICPHLVLEPV